MDSDKVIELAKAIMEVKRTQGRQCGKALSLTDELLDAIIPAEKPVEAVDWAKPVGCFERDVLIRQVEHVGMIDPPDTNGFTRTVFDRSNNQYKQVREDGTIPGCVFWYANIVTIEPKPSPGPSGVCYDAAHGDFYDAKTNERKGNTFYWAWRDRKDEFPKKPEPVELEYEVAVATHENLGGKYIATRRTSDSPTLFIASSAAHTLSSEARARSCGWTFSPWQRMKVSG
jgi:hypothetical protein